MDALSQTLKVVHLVGAIFINARFTAPWCYLSQRADSIASLLEPGAERLVIFHLITEGECYVEIDGQPPMKLIAGDAVLFPQGDAHIMTSQPGLPPAKGSRLDAVLARRPRLLTFGGGGATTRLLCGYLACEARLAKMLLAGLPSIVRVNVRGSNAGAWLESSVRYALAEARSPRPGDSRHIGSQACAHCDRAGVRRRVKRSRAERPDRRREFGTACRHWWMAAHPDVLHQDRCEGDLGVVRRRSRTPCGCGSTASHGGVPLLAKQSRLWPHNASTTVSVIRVWTSERRETGSKSSPWLSSAGCCAMQ